MRCTCTCTLDEKSLSVAVVDECGVGVVLCFDRDFWKLLGGWDTSRFDLNSTQKFSGESDQQFRIRITPPSDSGAKWSKKRYSADDGEAGVQNQYGSTEGGTGVYNSSKAKTSNRLVSYLLGPFIVLASYLASNFTSLYPCVTHDLLRMRTELPAHFQAEERSQLDHRATGVVSLRGDLCGVPCMAS
uniref:Uncharacterized protein n=1 Tax=Timema shepardi TaxID=629360 RepID=A0A7R9FY59_TIMSH|nr:unnamed protein product [Timema shepardi]